MFRPLAAVVLCASCLSVQPASADQTTSGISRREPQFENEHVKAWMTTIVPNQPLALHRHEMGRAIIALKGGQLKVVDETGAVINTYDWETGKAYWLDADPQGEMHGDLNDTNDPIKVIVVELKGSQVHPNPDTQ